MERHSQVEGVAVPERLYEPQPLSRTNDPKPCHTQLGNVATRGHVDGFLLTKDSIAFLLVYP